MNRLILKVGLAAFFCLVVPWPSGSPVASAQTYWLGRKPDLNKEEYVFDVPVPANLADILTCTDPKYTRLKDGIKEFHWDVDGKTYTFLENRLAWDKDKIEQGQFAFVRSFGVSAKDWAFVPTKVAGWQACKDVFLAQKKPAFGGGWSEVTPVLLKSAGKDNPQLRVNFNDDAPFQVTRHPAEYDVATGTSAATKKPQIVPVIHKNELYIAWQSWDRNHPTGKIFVSKVGIEDLGLGKLTAIRDVASGGTLVGFTVDEAGADYVLTAKAEMFENQPKGDFIGAIHKTWRADVVKLYTKGKGTELNNDQNTGLTFYGLCNHGTGRLVAAGDHLAAVFARRRYTPGDGLIHQEANALLMLKDLSKTPIKAENTVSHSTDQRLIFDGRDFLSLHQADSYPSVGLLIEKLRRDPGSKAPAVRFAVYACPTFGNDVYFELGGLAAEKDGFPVLFTATHNTEAVNDKNVATKREVAWDLAMVYVTRGFDTQAAPSNPYDIVGSGILAKGYAEPEEFTVNNHVWNPKSSDWSTLVPRKITRQVCWLTSYYQSEKETKKATCAKLVKLREGKYIALWEEHILADKQWKFARMVCATLTIEGDIDNKRIKKGPLSPLPPELRLHRGDDPVTLTIDGVPHAGWVTAGRTNKQLILHTLPENLKYKAHLLKLP